MVDQDKVLSGPFPAATRREFSSAPDTIEFDQGQDAVFAKLAGAMAFVGIVILLLGVLLGIAAILWKPTLLGAGICGVLATLFVAMGLLEYGAARHFRRIVTTHGRDVDNLMIALDELANVYAIQRWLWIVLGAIVLIALASTVTGYS